MKTLTLLFITAFLCISLAQTHSFKGMVAMQSGYPIIGATVQIPDLKRGAVTDVNGEFIFENLPAGTFKVVITSIGYASAEEELYFYGALQRDYRLTEQAINTDQVVVTGSKYEQSIRELPASSFILLPTEFNKKNYVAIDDALRYVSGVSMTYDQISIRGSSGYSRGAGTRVLVAIDGIPIYTGDTGEIIWEMIPMQDIERVEILKGPSSSLYGTSAIGGVINIITKSAQQQPLTHIRAFGGGYDKPSYSEWDWSGEYRTFGGISASHSRSIGKLGISASFFRYDNESYRLNDYSKRYLGYLKLTYPFDEDENLTVLFNTLVMNRGNFIYWKDAQNVLVPNESDRDTRVESNRSFVNVIYKKGLGGINAFEVRGSAYIASFDGIGVERTESDANLLRLESLTTQSLGEELTVIAGAEGTYAKVNSNLFSDPTGYSAAAYLQGEYKPFTGGTFTVGTRLDWLQLDTISSAVAVTPRFGFNYLVNDALSLRLSAATGFRAPTPAEVFTATNISGIKIIENTDLEPETSVAFELGAGYNVTPWWMMDGSLFWTEYNKFIEPNLTSSGGIQFINLQKARIQGSELLSTVTSDYGTFTAGYTYLMARDLRTGKAMKYRPRHAVTLGAKIPVAPFDVSLDFRYWSKVEEIDFQLTQPPFIVVRDGEKRTEVFVADATLSYTTTAVGFPMRVSAVVKNMFNYNYVEMIGNLAPIRNVSFGVEAFF